ncbi:MAG: hypothetical protein IIA44_06905 [Acidobacteria bacterium]|nr:hypothetical protein [Acidobacteriota bacterium]
MSDIQEVGIGRTTANVTTTTDGEEVAVISEVVKVTRPEMRVLIFAEITFDSGASTTGIIPRIRLGTTILGTLKSEANTHETTAALMETWSVSALDEVSGVDEVQYCATLEAVAGAADGTIHNATILVLLI